MNRMINLWLLLMMVQLLVVTSRSTWRDNVGNSRQVRIPSMLKLLRSRRAGSHEGSHLLQHLLDVIKAGHASTEAASHWQTQLMHWMKAGLVTETQVQTFLQTIQSLHISTDHGPSPFWLG